LTGRAADDAALPQKLVSLGRLGVLVAMVVLPSSLTQPASSNASQTLRAELANRLFAYRTMARDAALAASQMTRRRQAEPVLLEGSMLMEPAARPPLR
jgi:hypothetical protein